MIPFSAAGSLRIDAPYSLVLHFPSPGVSAHSVKHVDVEALTRRDAPMVLRSRSGCPLLSTSECFSRDPIPSNPDRTDGGILSTLKAWA